MASPSGLTMGSVTLQKRQRLSPPRTRLMRRSVGVSVGFSETVMTALEAAPAPGEET